MKSVSANFDRRTGSNCCDDTYVGRYNSMRPGQSGQNTKMLPTSDSCTPKMWV